MYRVVFEIQIKGMPNEIECLSKIREYLDRMSKCLGSTTSYVCFYRSVMVKVVPKVGEVSRSPISVPYVYEAVQQVLPITLVIEGDKVDEIALTIESVYTLVKNCGLTIRLIE